MSRSLASKLVVAFVSIAGLFGLQAPRADAAPVQPIPPVAAPVSADPVGRSARGTVILVHGGGWSGHDGKSQNKLMTGPGNLFRDRGWRVVSIDYEEGTAGLQDVLDAAGAELARGTSDGPLCLYGESAGGHLALVAASRLRAIDCVISVGAPTDIALYQTEGPRSPDARVRIVAYQMNRFFGTSAQQTAPWDLVSLAPSIHADVLLLQEDDDSMVPAVHAQRFQAARPTTQLVTLPAGEPADPSTKLVHGTVSATGRERYNAAIGALADRAVAARAAERHAARKGCPQVNRSLGEIGLRRLHAGLRCLARKDPAPAGAVTHSWRQTSVKLRGEVNAARVWGHLRETMSGRRALAAVAERRAQVLVHSGSRSRVTLRATPVR